jgi:myo-inositol 2-dehydrogenase/D-chiro-inositol 1-dehydrogenase
MIMGKKIRIGMLGAGRIGKLHGENLAYAVPQAELVAIADPFLNDSIIEWGQGTRCRKLLQGS